MFGVYCPVCVRASMIAFRSDFKTIAGIFDGHGGVQSGKIVSKYLEKIMPGAVRQALEVGFTFPKISVAHASNKVDPSDDWLKDRRG